jgi:hypothetical protein
VFYLDLYFVNTTRQVVGFRTLGVILRINGNAEKALQAKPSNVEEALQAKPSNVEEALQAKPSNVEEDLWNAYTEYPPAALVQVRLMHPPAVSEVLIYPYLRSLQMSFLEGQGSGQPPQEKAV